MANWCMLGFNSDGCLRAVAVGYTKDRVDLLALQEINKGNNCILFHEQFWEEGVPQKYKKFMYWVTSCDEKDKERIIKHLRKLTSNIIIKE